MPTTSALGASQVFQGTLLQIASSASPPAWTTIANVEDINLPLTSTLVDVSNSGDTFRRRVQTLLDMGKITFKIFWIMTEPTHENVAGGLRYIYINRILNTFRVAYPDGVGNGSVDSFPAYVSGFSITGKVGGVFEATCELSNSGPPTLI